QGAFFAFGAYASYVLLNKFNAYGLVEGAGLLSSIGIFILALIASVILGLIIGLVLEKIIIRRVYGDHLKQILITMGSNMVMLQILILIWGPNEDFVPIPGAFDGSFMLGDIVVSKFRVVAIIVGLIVLAAIQWVMTKTKLGIIVRAGVENPETVQTIGYNINRIFTGVFIVGAALAAIGGSMFTMYKMTVYPHCGDEYMIFALIVVIIGGLGSITGCFYGALMVGLAFNYVAFLAPQLALGTNIAIMLIVLLIKPKGLMGR
ncbi:MAG: branched-chain amino acid ABC transporter permease, partial [Desulfobacula sp.]|nr:branched-chain amino acid ABC transporter permease [Desulfobacula sp.]